MTIITIDGPTASGKSTVARNLAQKLGFYYLSSGMLYRGLAYILVFKYYHTIEQLSQLGTADIQKYMQDRLQYLYTPATGEQVLFDGENITRSLKLGMIDQYASLIAMNPHVRTCLLHMQHKLADNHDLVAEGRDTGSVVFSHATIKFFLTASPTVRAQRWKGDQEGKGNSVPFEQALAYIQQRDERDKTRLIAPLVIAEGAVIVDNSTMTVQETVRLMMEMIHRKQA